MNAPSYDHQFGPRVRAVGTEARARFSAYADRLSELSQELKHIADAFERADIETQAGLEALGLRVQSLADASLNNPLLSLFLGQMRPPYISQERWAMMSVEERLEQLGSLEGFLVFLIGGSTAHGVELYVMNPLRIRGEPGMEGEVLAYAVPGSTIVWSGEEQEINGTDWYAVTYMHPIMGLVTGWMSSSYLGDEHGRLGYGPETVAKNFDIQVNQEVAESGGALMAVSSDWLLVLDGPTWDYGEAADPVQWGGVVRWTGKSIDVDGIEWREVVHASGETGWVKANYLGEYKPPAGAPPPAEGKIWIELKDERSFSYYTVTDVDNYQSSNPDFRESYEIAWAHGIGPNVEVPSGALFSVDGVAMQGSGKMTVINQRTGEETVLYFELDNPQELHWLNEEGRPTKWEDGQFSNGHPYEIENPETAEFRPVSKATELTSGVSVAGPPSLRGTRIYVPELAGIPGNEKGVFMVEDAGGAFPEGSLRFDIFYEDASVGAQFYRDYTGSRVSIPAFAEQAIPPEIGLDTSS
jgi:hypothetical protein